MKYYIGTDLGTSSVKMLLVNGDGGVVRSVTREYPISFPAPDYSEQSAEDWWNAFTDGLSELIQGIEAADIKGIGVGGQMHGLVILDKDDHVIRPVILWNDGRTAEETDYLNTVIGKKRLCEMTANVAFAGFTAPKLLWIRKNEPENFAKIDKIMLPKDYINYRLTGVHCSDYSDAAGMLLLDVEHKCWSDEMLEICGVHRGVMPKLFESYDVVGTVKPEIAEQLGVPSVPVVAGAGDNAAAAIGTGTASEGRCNISVGTSGTVFIPSKDFKADRQNALHAFCHANGEYHLMGVVLSAASCNKWFCDEILKTKDYNAEQADISDDNLGNNHVLFLPYLMGERCPMNDTDARGTFTGLRMDTKRCDIVQSVLEGVAFAIRDNVEVARNSGIEINSSCICGGGAKSKLWCKIISNVLNIKLEIPVCEEGPGFGAALLSMVGAGDYKNITECVSELVGVKEMVKPDPEIAARYDKQYEKYKKLYPALRDTFKEIR